MAKATKIIEKKRVRKTVESITGINLELSLEEAIALRILCSSVVGSPMGTIREYTDNIYHNLVKIVNDLCDYDEFLYDRNYVESTVAIENGTMAVCDINKSLKNRKNCGK